MDVALYSHDMLLTSRTTRHPPSTMNVAHIRDLLMPCSLLPPCAAGNFPAA